MPELTAPRPTDGHYRVKPPTHCERHRRWRVWYDFGHFEHGIVYRHTTWRAQAPEGEQLEAVAWDAILALIDQAEDAAERERGERLPYINQPEGSSNVQATLI